MNYQQLKAKWQEQEADKQRKNWDLFKERIKEYNKEYRAKVGEFLKFKGRYIRFAYDWGNLLQTTRGGSFYLGDGYCDFSGSLEHGIDKDKIELTSEIRNGRVWFFDSDIWGANRGVDFDMPFRVWKIKREFLKQIRNYDILGFDGCKKCKGLNMRFNSLKCVYECLRCDNAH